jgi:ribosomal protein S27E
MNYEELIKNNKLIKISMMISDRNVSKNEKFASWLHLKVNGEFTLREKAILIKNGFIDLPLCMHCGSNPVKFQIKDPYLSNICSDPECCKIHSNEKRKNTSIEKYGTAHPTQSSIVKENFKKKSLEKWGVDNPAKADEIKLKIGNTVKENKMTIFIENNPNLDILEKIDSFTYKIKCKSCGHEQVEQRQLIRIYAKSSKIICEKCNPSIQIKTSILEDSISDFISLHYKGEFIKNYNGFNFTKKEADIYIPDLSLVIDINGLYWHSELFKENKYHINKKIEFEKAGIKFIQLWEDDLLNPIKREIVNSRLLNLFGLSVKMYARKLNIFFSKYNKEFKDFLDKNHLQGYVNASEYYCLRDSNGILISLMSFKFSKGIWELVRFCTLKNVTVTGGASRLINAFLETHPGEKLFSYADLDWSSTNMNNVYDSLGFVRSRITVPGYFWVRRGQRFSRNSFMKNKIQHLLLGDNESETECLHRLGYYRVYNSGNLYYEMQL